MKLKHILIIVALCFSQTAKAQLSESATISILTCGPGDDFYTTFGHSAIRVCDTAQKEEYLRGTRNDFSQTKYDTIIIPRDYVYNYGTFDFDTPNFYWKFAKGKLEYCLSKAHYTDFLNTYVYEGRYVIEQPLDLTQDEKNKIYEALEFNYKPENRNYLYDFFIDNCATRIRDIINNNLIDRELFIEHTPENVQSYRDVLYGFTEERLLWWRLGIDLLLGSRCDKVCTNLEQMFSPIDMMIQFDTTHLSDHSGKLANKKILVINENRTPQARSVSPTLIFWTICIATITLTIVSWKKRWRLTWFDRILYGIVGAISLFLLFMWFGTDHYCTKNNWNVLWASPLFVFLSITARKPNRWIILVQLLMVLAVIAGQWFIPQQLNSAIIPIAVTLAIRLIDNLRKTH